jgi:CheY-like chemotaxis protein
MIDRPAMPAVDPAIGSATVLIVEDEPVFLDAFTRTLSQRGYKVLRASGPRQALEVVQGHPLIDAVLSDVAMPQMRGPDLVHKIGQLAPETTCVLMSGGVVAGEVPQGVPVVRKPLSPRDLVAAIHQAVARSAELRAKASGGYFTVFRIAEGDQTPPIRMSGRRARVISIRPERLIV